MTELRLYKSPWKAAKLLLGCGAFVALGVWLLGRPDTPSLVAWLSIGFFGLGFPIALFQLLDRRPQIIINEIGVFDRTTHKEFINWELIEEAYLTEVHGQHFICLVVDAAFEPSRTQSSWRRRMSQLNKSLGFQELNINLASVSANPIRLAEFIQLMRTADLPEREFRIKQAIDKL